jgi:hypothetical protein
MNLRKLFSRRRPKIEETALFNLRMLEMLVERGIEPVDAGRPRAGDYVWVKYGEGVHLAGYHGSGANGVVAMVGVLHYTSEGLTSMPCFVPMTDIARTGHSREDTLRAYYENGRWVFVPSVDEDTQPMETIR